MHDIELILTITGGLSAALLLGYLTHRIGLSPIVGYLLAGLIVGPHTPGFVADRHLADQLAEIGVILLMFGVGLHFHLKDLLAVRAVALTGALCQSIAATALGAWTAHAFGWSWPSGIVFGLALSVASTVVLTRVLSDNGDLHSRTGRIAVGWLVVEDLFTVLVLVLLPALFGPGAQDASGLPMALGLAMLKIGVLAVFTFVVGGRLIPRLLAGIAATHSRELFTLAVLAIALGIAVASAYWFGASMALGAFLAGMVVGQSEFSQRAASEALPMRDAFAVLFFVSVGMLFDPRQLLHSPGVAAVALSIVLIGKPLAAFVIVVLMHHGSKVALGVAVALAQIGEFSFILAAVGKSLKILSEDAANILVAASIASIALNPVLYRLVGPAEAWLRRHPGLWRRLNPEDLPADDDSGRKASPAHQAVVVGYGPIGQTVTRLLAQRGIEPTVIELNVDTARRLRSEGVHAIYGDASQREILESAGLERAFSLILTAPATAESTEMIRLAREINPTIQVLARSAFHGETAGIRSAGATHVFSGEGEVALAMTEYILQQLGATPEQLDGERERVRAFLAT
ncbi:cation:proton antiporter [Paludibaculum fermentans]|uniref:Cation:proton antiporter n=1 Tax=Paludibaculum fermentans TaxID=1473598 RepID=A0A7S7SNY0_PALFE|nr:cation:proton antiporter [Paludibaculum fermentans]